MPATQDDFSQRLAQQVSAARKPIARPTGPAPIQSIAKPAASAPRPAEAAKRPDLAPEAPVAPESDEFSSRLADAAQRSEVSRGDAQFLRGSNEFDAPPEQGTRDRGPVGQGERVLKQGECMAGIAHETGHLWNTIWDDGANTELRETRKDPYVLLPGDRVTIPPIRRKSEGGQTEMRHRFRKKGQPERFYVRVLEDDEPRRNEPYSLVIDDRDPINDVTDAEGQVTRVIPAEAKKAVLTVGEGKQQRTFEFQLGALDPLSEMSGVRGRLRGLGFDCEPTGPELTEELRTALKDYQRSRKLKVTGQPDEPTRSKLKEDYGC